MVGANVGELIGEVAIAMEFETLTVRVAELMVAPAGIWSALLPNMLSKRMRICRSSVVGGVPSVVSSTAAELFVVGLPASMKVSTAPL